MIMTPAQMWLSAAIILFILEIVVSGFVLANFAVAAMAASVAAWLDASVNVQVIVFVITCLVSFVTVRPLLHRTFMKKTQITHTGAGALIGRIARVTDAIPVPPEYGRVQVDGDSWSASSQSGIAISAGATVRILRVDSVVLFVEPVE